MARVTIERLLNQCESRFEAVFLASYLAQEVVNGKSFDINTDNKYAVIALRLIEYGKVSIPELREIVLKRCILDCQVEAAKNSSIINENFDNVNNDNTNIGNEDINVYDINDDISDAANSEDSYSDSIISQDNVDDPDEQF